MVSLRDDWKKLRPLLGNFVGKLDELVEPSITIEETLDKVREAAYNKGYNQGCTDCREKDICQNCSKKQFYEQNIQYGTWLTMWRKINCEEQNIILDIMKKFAERRSKN